MANGVLVYREDPLYKDHPAKSYQFQKYYLNKMEQFLDDWVIYYKPHTGIGQVGYFAIVRIASIDDGPRSNGVCSAQVEPDSFMEFDRIVGLRRYNGFWETTLDSGNGKSNFGNSGWAVRDISENDFEQIIQHGFITDTVEFKPNETSKNHQYGMAENDQEKFIYDDPRTRIERAISTVQRDRKFRQLVIQAYDQRCAITGLLLGGAGKAEVEAAHIKPVARNGPDVIANCMALSRTAHGMFDEGLIALDKNFKILVSTQTIGYDDPTKIINPTKHAILPEKKTDWPAQQYLAWHRNNCFKP